MKLKFVAVWLLVLLGSSLLVANKQPAADQRFTVYSVSISGNDCILSVKDESKVIYYTTGWDYDCSSIRSGETLLGHFGMAGYRSIWFDKGYKDKKGREKYTHPFAINTQEQ